MLSFIISNISLTRTSLHLKNLSITSIFFIVLKANHFAVCFNKTFLKGYRRQLDVERTSRKQLLNRLTEFLLEKKIGLLGEIIKRCNFRRMKQANQNSTNIQAKIKYIIQWWKIGLIKLFKITEQISKPSRLKLPKVWSG